MKHWRMPFAPRAGIVLLPLVVAAPLVAQAHGFGQRYDLPVPLWIWVAGAASAVVLSFVVIGLRVREAHVDHGYLRINLLRWKLGRLLVDRRLVHGVQVISVMLFVVVVVAGFVGSQNPIQNIAPTVMWVIWWVGFAYLSALIGDVWAVVNPLKTLFSLVERRVDHSIHRIRAEPRVVYPRALGVWPAILLFGTFAWIELVYSGRAVPAQLSVLVIVYAVITWTGMSIFGRMVWLRHGDPFTVVFGLLSRFAPIEVRVVNPDLCRQCDCDDPDADGGCVNCLECFARAADFERELNVRPFAVGLLRAHGVSSSMTVFVLVLLATVTFDGFAATPVWSALEIGLYNALRPLGDARITVIETTGLVIFAALFAVVYRGFTVWMARAAGGRPAPSRVGQLFVLSLIPIALAYHLAHYFTYLLIQGQFAFQLISDPFGFGWNLFGTAGFFPDIGVVGARFAWYTAVVAIVVGHIVAVYVAHVIALRELRERGAVLKSQLVMLVLMVGYTTVSLWIIAQPIVETAGGG